MAVLTPNSWGRVQELFHGALERSQEDRRAFIHDGVAGNRRLEREVLRLLEAHEGASVLENGALAGIEHAPISNGSDIAGYRILQVLGRGGMGVVYRAEQRYPRREVALKIVRPGPFGHEMLRRFEHEAMMLARLDHPCIAHIYEAGFAEFGGERCPFLAMELINGTPIVDFANRERLSLRRRMSLLADVAKAIHHAHQRAVVHRDLKPDNILVNAIGQVKVIDFGVARSMDAETLTLHGELIGTLRYMSPEQVAGDPDEVDVRSDIYTIGVVGYELISGRSPVESEAGGLDEIVRQIREVEPKALGSIDRSWRGDVETIIARAMNKDPELRYQSASELATDIRCYLENTPILARPTSRVYRLRKFARRNRGIVAIGSVAMTALVIATVATSWGRYQSNQRVMDSERHGIQRLLWSFKEVGRNHSDMDDILEIIRLTSHHRSVQSPERGRFEHDFWGTRFYRLGDYERAWMHFDRAREYSIDIAGENALATMRAENLMLDARVNFGDPWKVEIEAREAIHRWSPETQLIPFFGGSQSPSVATRSRGLRLMKCVRVLARAWRDQGRLEDAEHLLRYSLIVVRGLSFDSPPEQQWDVHDIILELAFVLAHHDPEEASALLEYLVALYENPNVPGSEPRYLKMSEFLGLLGEVLVELGELDRAERLLREAIFMRSIVPPTHRATLRMYAAIGRLLMEQGRLKEGLDTLEYVVDNCHRLYPDWMETAEYEGAYGAALLRAGRHDEGMQFLDDARKKLRARGLGDNDHRVIRIREALEDKDEY